MVLFSPTQQSWAAVSRITASGTVGFFCAAGLDVVLAFVVGVGRAECMLTVALAAGSDEVLLG